MAEEIKVWGDGDTELWSFGETVDIPNEYVEVSSGNQYLTKTINRLAERVYVRMKKNKKGGYSRAISVIAPKAIVETAKALAAETEEARLVKRHSATEYRAKREEKNRFEMNEVPDAANLSDHAYC